VVNRSRLRGHNLPDSGVHIAFYYHPTSSDFRHKRSKLDPRLVHLAYIFPLV